MLGHRRRCSQGRQRSCRDTALAKVFATEIAGGYTAEAYAPRSLSSVRATASCSPRRAPTAKTSCRASPRSSARAYASDISKVNVDGGKLSYKRPMLRRQRVRHDGSHHAHPGRQRASVGVRAGRPRPAARAPSESVAVGRRSGRQQGAVREHRVREERPARVGGSLDRGLRWSRAQERRELQDRARAPRRRLRRRHGRLARGVRRGLRAQRPAGRSDRQGRRPASSTSRWASAAPSSTLPA